jgi:hypothetical protein
MLNFMAEPDQESEVICRVAINGAVGIAEAPFELSVFVCAGFGPVEATVGSFLLEVAVFDAFGSVVSVEQICPRDIHQDDEHFGLKGNLWIVEDLHCC